MSSFLPATSPVAPTRSDDQAWILRLRSREPSAYEELVRAHTRRLLAIARRILGSEEDAKDAVQDTFLAAFQSLDRFRGDAGLATWLSRIAVNHCLMRLRSRRRKPEKPISDFLPSFLPDGHAAKTSSRWRLADSELQTKEVQQLVRSAISKLPERYRTVLLLRDIEEMDTETVARLLELNTNTVKVRLHRARQALRGLLDPDFRKGAL